MKRIITGVIVLAALTGCNLKSVPQAKKEAYGRWYRTRAQILYGVAVEHFKAGRLDKARAKTLEALALVPDYWRARLLLGKIHIEQGRFTLAVDELTKVHQAWSKSAEVLYLLGVAQEKAGLLDEALISYRRSQALDSSNTSAAIAAAEVLAAQGHLRQAQLYVESYLSLADGEPGMYELAGRLAMMRKEYDKAAEQYQQAWDLDYGNIGYLEALARAQFFAGRYQEAMESLQALTTASGYSAGAWVYTMLGDCYMAASRPHRARDNYLRASEMDPSTPGIWTNLARAALALGDEPRAILCARRALSLDATLLDATLLLGYALLRDGQITRSRGVLRQAMGRYPRSAELYCLLGRAHAAAGDEAEAMRCYARAMRIEPDNALARELFGATETKKVSRANQGSLTVPTRR